MRLAITNIMQKRVHVYIKIYIQLKNFNMSIKLQQLNSEKHIFINKNVLKRDIEKISLNNKKYDMLKLLKLLKIQLQILALYVWFTQIVTHFLANSNLFNNRTFNCFN